MRDFLTGFAIILVIVLTTALVAPYFVDWNGQRAFVEARLSHALGQKVTVGGDIDVKLLPTPYLVLGQTVIGGDDDPIRIGIRHLRLELSVAPLLHGEFEVVDARLEEPTIRIALERDRTLPSLPSAPAFRADVRFDHIAVADGTLAIADPGSGRTFVLDNLDFDADAASLAGPFKGNGAEGPTASRTKFRFATTTASGGKARAHLIFDETPGHAGLDLDGNVALTSAGRQTIRQSFDGTIRAFGHLDPASGGPVAWRLSGPLRADPQKATLAGGELRIGAEDSGGLVFTTNAEADLGASPGVRLDMSAKHIDIDRLAGVTSDGVAPPPPKVPDLATLRRVLAAAMPPLPTSVDLSIDDATWGGETLSDIAAHVDWGQIDRGQADRGMAPDAKRRPTLQLAANGPGGSHVGVDGVLSTAPGLSFVGSVDASSDNTARALRWLVSVDPDVTVRDLPFKTIKLAGKVTARPEAIDVAGLALTLDRSTLSGTLHLAPQADPPRLKAELRAAALDIDALPDLPTWRRSSDGFDLDVGLAADAVKVAQVGAQGGARGLGVGHIDLALTKSGSHVALTRFSARDLGGAQIQATGTLDPAKATLALSVDARRLEAAAALIRQLAPGPWADRLNDRAAALAPAKLALDTAWVGKASGDLAPTRLAVHGTLGATTLDAHLAPDAEHAGAMSIGGTLDAPEGSRLLSQLGLSTLPLDIIGKSRVMFDAKGPADQRLDTTIQATFGTTVLGVSGRFALLAADHDGTGSFTAKSADLSPLLQSLAVAFPDMTGRIPASIAGGIAIGRSGFTLDELNGTIGGTALTGTLRWAPPGSADKPSLTGALAIDQIALADLFGLALGPAEPPAPGASWSKLAFASGLVDPPRANVALRVHTLPIRPDLIAQDASLELGIAQNLVTMRHTKAGLAGGSIAGDLTLRRDGAQGTLEGTIALDGVGVADAALAANVSGHLTLAGSGASALALVTSLAGTGDATASAITIPGADPKALVDTFAALEADDLAVDSNTILKALQDKAKTALNGGTRRFSLGLASGVLRVSETGNGPAVPPVATQIDGVFDLAHERASQTVRETLLALPKNWSGPPPSITYTFAGPPNAPTRAIDVGGFIDAVATRALARESARIEAYELDARERAFFNARLDSERRREQERIKADADARKAEADRVARAEAKRKADATKDDPVPDPDKIKPGAPPSDTPVPGRSGTDRY